MRIVTDKFGEELYRSDGHDHDFSLCELEAEDFSMGILTYASFREASLYWVTMYDADLSHASFSGATLRGVDLKEANCRNADFSGTRFSRDSLGLPTELKGTDLAEAILEGCVFEGAVYDKRTKFPKDFDPYQYADLELRA